MPIETESTQEVRCADCNRVLMLPNGDQVLPLYHRVDGKSLCLPCSRSQTYRQCDNCSDIEFTNVIHNTRTGEICDNCYENYYTECNHCNELVHRDNTDGDGNCEDCQSSDEIDFHDYKVNDEKFIGTVKGDVIKSLRPFGIELEVVYRNSEKAKTFCDTLPREVGVTTDGSIQGMGLELQTPPSNGKIAEEMITNMSKNFVRYDFKVNKTCGFHLHIDANDIDSMSPDSQFHTLKCIWLFYIAFEDVIQSFLPKSRKNGNNYCKGLRNDYNFKEIADSENMSKLEKIWYRARTNESLNQAKGDSKHSSRYRGINLHTLLSARHLEIRYHSGTINSRKILEWVHLHTSIIDILITQGTSIDWLARMSANGDIVEKTREFFNFLGKRLSKENLDYFNKRQKTFYSIPAYTITPSEEKIVQDILTAEEEI